MSIYAYTGLPGSGKSYSVVEHQILPALKAGRRVVTNVALDWELCRSEFPGVELVEFPASKVAADPASIYEYVTPGCVLVLDEVWRIFPAGLKANHVPEPFRKLLAEHRHMVDAAGNSCQIVLVTQDLAQISAFARQLVEQTFRTVKLSSVGLQQQFRVDVYNGPATGPNPPENSRIRQIFGSYHASVWRFYRTHTLKASPDSPGKVNEKAVDRRGNVLMRPVMVFGAIAALALPVWGFTGLTGTFEKAKSEPAPAPEAAGQAPTLAPSSSVVDHVVGPGALLEVAPDKKKPSELAVLVGYVENLDDAEKSYAIIRQGDRLLTRPLRYCDSAAGFLSCYFPDLGSLTL